MNYYSMTDTAITEELGERLKTLRLRQNISQQKMAEDTTLSLNAIRALEEGRAKLTTLIAVLRYLDHLDDIDAFIPALPVSPIQMAALKTKKRVRASKRSPFDKLADQTPSRGDQK